MEQIPCVDDAFPLTWLGKKGKGYRHARGTQGLYKQTDSGKQKHPVHHISPATMARGSTDLPSSKRPRSRRRSAPQGLSCHACGRYRFHPVLLSLLGRCMQRQRFGCGGRGIPDSWHCSIQKDGLPARSRARVVETYPLVRPRAAKARCKPDPWAAIASGSSQGQEFPLSRGIIPANSTKPGQVLGEGAQIRRSGWRSFASARSAMRSQGCSGL